MAEGPGAGQIHVICETDAGHFDLRLYGAEGSTVPSWWIGMFDSSGALRRTWISNGADLTSDALLRWLRPIVGYEVASRLVHMALHVHTRPAQVGRKVVAVH